MNKKINDYFSQYSLKLKRAFSKLLFGVFNYDKIFEKKDLEHYKNEAFYKLAILFIIIGIFPISYGAYLFFLQNNVIAGVLELLSYFVILLLLLSDRINIIMKRYIFVLCIFLLGLMLLLITGPLGAGLLVIYSSFGLASVLLNRKQSIFFIHISLITFFAISIFLHLGLLDNLAIILYSESWYIMAITTQSLGTLFVLVINNIFNNIENQIDEIERAAKITAESERSKSVILSNLPGMAFSCDYNREGTMRFASRGCIKLTGYSPESLINNKDVSYNSLIVPEYRELLWKEWERVIVKRLPFKYEYEIITATGERKWVMELAEGVYDNNGDVVALEGIILDVSDRKKQEEETKRLLDRTLSMFNNHEAAMLLIEPSSGDIIESNMAARAFYGYTEEELLNMKIQDFNTLEMDEISSLYLKNLRYGRQHLSSQHQLKSGEVRVVDVYSSTIEYGGKKVLFSIIFDVTEREIIAKENEFLATHDYLTGLGNRRYFDEQFEQRVKGRDFPISLLLGNIDGFKTFNDAFGQVKGNEVLIGIADRLATLVIDGDAVARVGGDEFAILVSGKKEPEVKKYMDKLTLEFDNVLRNSGKDEIISISWGYGIQRNEQDSLDDLHREAEAFVNNRKFYNINSRRSNTVNVIMETLFTKSEREKKHSERVGKLCEAVARQINMSKSEIDKIRVAGLLHDIGKIGIDESILNKNGKLDSIEWEIMKLHPAKGASILSKTIEYNEIADIVLSHHERYDGKGYPNGLKGEEIPIMARIVAVSDAYDAMTEQRTYGTPFSRVEAITELKRCSGSQFDPDIVLDFISVISEMENTE